MKSMYDASESSSEETPKVCRKPKRVFQSRSLGPLGLPEPGPGPSKEFLEALRRAFLEARLINNLRRRRLKA